MVGTPLAYDFFGRITKPGDEIVIVHVADAHKFPEEFANQLGPKSKIQAFVFLFLKTPGAIRVQLFLDLPLKKNRIPLP